jgi:hypothetical protein
MFVRLFVPAAMLVQNFIVVGECTKSFWTFSGLCRLVGVMGADVRLASHLDPGAKRPSRKMENLREIRVNALGPGLGLYGLVDVVEAAARRSFHLHTVLTSFVADAQMAT